MILEKINGENKMQKEIGSNFWEIDLDKNKNNKFWWDENQYNTEYFVSGRNAILGLCRTLCNKEKKIVLPAYTCSTVVEPFIQENWQIEYYDVNKDLSINLNSLDKIIGCFKPSVVLIHSYFGFGIKEAEEVYIHSLKQQGIIIIEDLTQKLFSDNKLSDADYYVFSLRKFLAVPDGGMLISHEKIDLDLNEENSELIATANKAFELKKTYMIENDLGLKEQFRKKFQKCNELLADNKLLTMGSKQSLEIYRKTNFDPIIKQRIDNYNSLRNALKSINCIDLIFEQADNKIVPLYLPLYVKNEKRKELQSFLAGQDIYCPIIWPKYSGLGVLSKDTEYIYNNILCIPIDQRYGQKEMEKISKSISEFAK